MPRGDDLFAMDPQMTFQFSVLVEGRLPGPILSFFSEVSGFSADVATVEYKTFNRNSGMPEVQILPGRLNSGTFTLKRGMTTDTGFWDWFQAVTTGNIAAARSTVTIAFMSRDYVVNRFWTLFNAWPSKFELDSMQASESNYRIETLTLVYERMEYAVASTQSA